MKNLTYKSKKIVLLSLLICVFMFGGCDQDLNQKLQTNISEFCTSYFIGETQNYYVEVFGGEREEPYELNGISEEKVTYSIVSITPKSSNTQADEIEYCVELNGKTYEGAFDESPFDGTLAADFCTSLKEDDTIFVYIKLRDNTEVAKMTCLSNTFLIEYSTALSNIATNSVNEILSATENLSLGFECYVQVINKMPMLEKYFWCVNIVINNGKILTYIIDIETGEILAKNL